MASETVEHLAEIEIKRNKLGWGGVVRRTSRPYAVVVRGKFLMTSSGATRTFGSRSAAKKAGLEALAQGYGKGE